MQPNRIKLCISSAGLTKSVTYHGSLHQNFFFRARRPAVLRQLAVAPFRSLRARGQPAGGPRPGVGSALGEGAGRQVDRRRPPHALQPRDQAEQREEASGQPALHQGAPRKLRSAAARLPRAKHQRQNLRTKDTVWAEPATWAVWRPFCRWP